MNLAQLQYFVSVAEHSSFTLAALEQHVSQPAISKQIKELENEYGCTFFDRSTHNVKLTAAGEEFLKYAKEILSIDLDSRNRMQYMARSQKGQVKIAFLSDIRYELKACLSRFCEKYPSMQINMTQMCGSEMYKALKTNDHDFYFALKQSLSIVEGFSYLHVRDTGLALIYPEKWKEEIDVHDLSTIAEKPFAYFPRRDGMFLFDHTMEVLKQRGITPRITNYYNDADAAAFSAEAGICLTVLPEFMFRKGELSEVCVEKIPGEDTLIESVVAWKNGIENRSSLLFLDLLKDMYGRTVRS